MAVKSYIDAIREAMDLALEKITMLLFLVKTLVKMVVFSVLLMVCRLNMAKSAFSIRR